MHSKQLRLTLIEAARVNAPRLPAGFAARRGEAPAHRENARVRATAAKCAAEFRSMSVVFVATEIDFCAQDIRGRSPIARLGVINFNCGTNSMRHACDRLAT
jgi:hypothetical protein